MKFIRRDFYGIIRDMTIPAVVTLRNEYREELRSEGVTKERRDWLDYAMQSLNSEIDANQHLL